MIRLQKQDRREVKSKNTQGWVLFGDLANSTFKKIIIQHFMTLFWEKDFTIY